jgi:hypothetical protein
MSGRVQFTLVVLIFALWVVFSSGKAHADPVDTVAVQGALVCASLAENPTVANFDAWVATLLDEYTEESEHRVMAYAMQTLCPQYQYLAYQSLRQRLAQIQQGAVI